ATGSNRILAVPLLLLDAVSNRCPNAGGNRDRRQWRARSDRGSCTGRCTSTQRSLVPPYLRRESKVHLTAAPQPPARQRGIRIRPGAAPARRSAHAGASTSPPSAAPHRRRDSCPQRRTLSRLWRVCPPAG